MRRLVTHDDLPMGKAIFEFSLSLAKRPLFLIFPAAPCPPLTTPSRQHHIPTDGPPGPLGRGRANS
jgi:hypothetical protein